jgi:hypothetical protein
VSSLNQLQSAEALTVEPKKDYNVQLKKETLGEIQQHCIQAFRNADRHRTKRTVIKAVGFEGKALKTAWAIAKAESNATTYGLQW